MPAEALRIDRGAGDDQFQVAAFGEKLLEIPDQEVDVEAALVGLIDDQRVVLAKQPIALNLGQQNAVGHQLDVGVIGDMIAKANLVANRVAEVGVEFAGDAHRDRSCSDPARLGVADESRDPTSGIETDFRELSCLSRTGFATDDDDLIFGDRASNLFTPCDDRKLHRIGGLWAVSLTLGEIDVSLRHAVYGRRLEPQINTDEHRCRKTECSNPRFLVFSDLCLSVFICGSNSPRTEPENFF